MFPEDSVSKEGECRKESLPVWFSIQRSDEGGQRLEWRLPWDTYLNEFYDLIIFVEFCQTINFKVYPRELH